MRVGELGDYLENRVEPYLRPMGWEAYLRDKYSGKRIRQVELYAIGVFVGIQVLAIFLVLIISITPTDAEIFFFVLDLIAIPVTIFALTARRRSLKYGKSKEH